MTMSFQKQPRLMREPISSAALLTAGISAATTGATAYSTGKMNKKNRKFAENMYWTQRNNALEDWTRNNEYNHPSAQMARLRQAGLNPNLVYGSGVEGSSSPVRGTEAAHWEGKPMDFTPMGNAVSSILDARIKEANYDNLRSQNTVIQEQAAYLKAQRLSLDVKNANTESSTALNNIITSLKSANFGNDVQYRKQQLEKLVADTDYTINQDARASTQAGATFAETVARTLNLNYQRQHVMPAQVEEINTRIKTAGIQQQLMELEKELKEIGIYPGDPWYTRIAARAAQRIKQEVDNTKSDKLGSPQVGKSIEAYFKKKR